MWFVILKTRLPGDPGALSAQPECCSSRMTPMQHTRNPRPLPKCAQTLLPCIPLPYRTSRRPDAVSCSTQKTHLPVSELVLTLLSMTWDTEVKTSPPRAEPGSANRLGNRQPMTTRPPAAAAPDTDRATATQDRASQVTQGTQGTGRRTSSTAALTASRHTRTRTVSLTGST